MAKRPKLRLLSSVRGRQRWEIPTLVDRPRFALALVTVLEQTPGISRTTANPLTGRVLLNLDPELTHQEVAALLEEALDTPPVDPEAYDAILAERAVDEEYQLVKKLGIGARILGVTVATTTVLKYVTVAAPVALVGRAVGWVLGTAGIVITGSDYLRATWRTFTGQKGVTTGTLVGTATVASVLLNEQATALIVLWLLNLGELMELRTLRRARAEIRALLVYDEDESVWQVVGEVEQRQKLSAIQPQDLVAVYAGDRIPVDGQVELGSATVNQAPITGENMPVMVSTGDRVYAGSLLVAGDLRIKVEQVGNETVVGRLIQRVEEAQELRPRIQVTGEIFARYVVPSSFFLSGAVFLLTGDPTRALTMLLVVCPCAAGLSTPTAVRAGIGNGASRGVLIKGGNHLETMAQVDAMVFDKTGTLTEGSPTVKRIQPLVSGYTEDEILALAASAELHSQHPLSLAVVGEAEGRRLTIPPHDKCESLDGLGMVAQLEGHQVLVGSQALLAKHNIAVTRELEGLEAEYSLAGETTMYVAHQGKPIALVGVKDRIRDDAASVLARLRRAGMSHLIMVTGDREGAAQPVADAVGITDCRARLLPEEKYEVIRALQAQGHRVAMVGDGINDAPALAIADVGIAMGTAGSDVAIETADIALAADRLEGLDTTVRLSRRSIQTIRQNYAMALGVNSVGLGLAAFGTINPIMAAVLHNVATVMVVFNSSRLMRYVPEARQLVAVEPPAQKADTEPEPVVAVVA